MKRMIVALFLAVAAPATASDTRALRWTAADATGRAGWQALLADMPDLAADARAARFDAGRGLRQILADLDGDGRAELLLLPRIGSWCGSAGCAAHVLRRTDAGAWRAVCMTNARPDAPLLLRETGPAGWRGFDAAARVSFLRGADGALACEEAPLPRRR